MGQSGCLFNLGYALLLQERYDEAMRCLESAIQICPNSSNAYASLADVYLYRDVDPERALELIEQGEQFFGLMSYAYGLGVAIRGSRAFALALSGQHLEAEKALAQGFREVNKKQKPALASLYLSAGHVKRLAGKQAEAVADFNRVREIDPSGIFHDLANRALRALGEAS